MADDFVGTSSSGKTGDKATLIAEAKRDTNTYTSAVSTDLNVKMFAPNVAVVKGFDVQLVDDGVFVPKRVNGRVVRRVRHAANSWRNNGRGAMDKERHAL